MDNILITNGTWISPGSVFFYRCSSCNERWVSYTTRQPQRDIPYDGAGQSPTIEGTVFYLASDWCSKSGLTWSRVGTSYLYRWWPVHGYHRGRACGILLKDPRFLISPNSLAFAAGNYDVVLETFKDQPPLKARKGDGPFEVRTSWRAVSEAAQAETEERLCLSCLHKAVEAKASHRQGHLTLAPLASLSETARAAVVWLSNREPSDPGVFNHGVVGATVRTHSGRVALIDSPTDGDAIITSPDYPGEDLVLPAGGGPWVAVHPWPNKEVGS